MQLNFLVLKNVSHSKQNVHSGFHPIFIANLQNSPQFMQATFNFLISLKVRFDKNFRPILKEECYWKYQLDIKSQLRLFITTLTFTLLRFLSEPERECVWYFFPSISLKILDGDGRSKANWILFVIESWYTRRGPGGLRGPRGGLGSISR